METSFSLLVKQKIQHAPEYIQWLGSKLEKGAIVASNEKLVSILLGDLLTQQFSFKGLILTDKDYLSPIWENRPALPAEKAYLIDGNQFFITGYNSTFFKFAA